ncbi:SRPBCC family protein [Leifsonia sp. F6_8S_P_1B]|uniref:SRPBCC family protein n=1 Tax=Leifsonia williamsii TaxID=3035919 RepID=A0ABT8KCY9_9MICO|nr:SRPBCC family protein [Leifsonia williamsii]MDN4615311.1 SRPBCC family protein [Leifsonia williamsii]
MRRIVNTIDIAASPHAIYAALRDLGTYPTWLRHSLVYRGTTTKAGADPTYQDSTMLGRMPGSLIADTPDHELRFHQRKPSGALDAVIEYDVADDGTTELTRVTRIGELTTHGVLRAVQPVLVRMAAAESRRTMAALKAHVEAAPPASPTARHEG